MPNEMTTTTLYGVVRRVETIYRGSGWAPWAPGDTRETARRSGKHQDYPEGLPTGTVLTDYELLFDENGNPLTFTSLAAAIAASVKRLGTEVKLIRGIAALITK
ncbi:unnamed protein product [Sphagnum balticum]